MRSRDIAVALVATAAMYLSLQGTPDISVQLRWLVGTRREDPLPGPVPISVPLPLMTDLDGDGKEELLLLLDGGMKLRALSIPLLSGENLVDPVILHEVELVADDKHPSDKRPVAIAAGFLASGTSKREQHVVIVREDLSVMCLRSDLSVKWERSLEGAGLPRREQLFGLDQVAVTLTPQGGYAGQGLVIIGASLIRHHSGPQHNRSEARAYGYNQGYDAADPLGIHVEALGDEEENGRDVDEELTQEEAKKAEAEHFSIVALSGKSGHIIWEHKAQVVAEKVASPHHRAMGRPDHALQLDGIEMLSASEEALLLGNSGSGRRYRRSLLRLLPHSWSDPSDTRLQVAVLNRYSSTANHGRTNVGIHHSVHEADDKAHGTVGKTAVVVARTREGLEAVTLSEGKLVAMVALPATGSGPGVYADINGDAIVDHVQVIGARGAGWGHLHSGMALGHFSKEASPKQAELSRRLPPCYALAVSGLPPKEQLFNGSVCHDGGALINMKERLSRPLTRNGARTAQSLDLEVDTALPGILPRTVIPKPDLAGGDKRTKGVGRAYSSENGQGSDVIFAVSTGIVTSYNSEGTLNWQHTRGPKWDSIDPQGRSVTGYVLPFGLEKTNEVPDHVRFRSHNEHVMVVGQDRLCVYDGDGRLVGSSRLVVGPSQRPIIADFDGDGMNDVVLVGWGGAAAGYALELDPGTRVLFVAVMMFIGAILVVASVYMPPPAGTDNWRRGGHKNRRTDGKLKRATD